jgi:hypothetical protein
VSCVWSHRKPYPQERVGLLYEVALARVVDPATLAEGVRGEVDCTGLGWLDITGDVVITRAVHDPSNVEMTTDFTRRMFTAV